MAKPTIEDSIYTAEFPEVEGKFTYIMKQIGAELRSNSTVSTAEVHGHGQETSGQ